ncbi:MAG: Crp/Fnr family transcriptional regulator [Proteobacteria bacterium]|nr:Crp/Fnr family transcriptional regulator [Pseudomonadota bacterium]
MLTQADVSANHILGSLTQLDVQRLLPHLHPVNLALGDVLYRRGENPEYVHFPADCLIAKLHVMHDGTPVEVAVIGNDGMAGITLFTGGEDFRGSAVTSAAGTAFRMHGEVLKDECRHDSGLHDALLRYTQSLLTQMAQTELCNRYHTIEQQLCRWLLLSLDRVQARHLMVAHHPVAFVTARQRESVANAAAKLQRNGAIRYHWGYIEVIDRKKLEQLVCECYEAVTRETAQFGAAASQSLATSH